MIDRRAKLSLARQAKVLGISRGSIYYQPQPVGDADLKLMHRIDQLHIEFPFAGSRMLKGLLVQEGFSVGRLHVASLMKRMGIEALYRKPNTSKPAPGHKIYHSPLCLNQCRTRLVCCGTSQSRAGTTSVRWTLPTSPWRGALGMASNQWRLMPHSTLPPWSTGPPAASWLGGCRSRWTRASAPRRRRRLWRNMASPRSSTRIKVAGSRSPTSVQEGVSVGRLHVASQMKRMG